MRVRQFFADTLAMIIFSTVVGMFIEIVISGMTLRQSVLTRLIATVVNIFTGGLNGLFRDWMFRAFGTTPKTARWFTRAVLDTLAFFLFQMPLYAGILYTSGASLQQIVIACGTASVSIAPLGYPYGFFLDLLRKLFRADDIAKSS